MTTTAKELLEGLRNGSIIIRASETPVPIEYYPAPAKEPVGCRGWLNFYRNESRLLCLRFSIYVSFDDDEGFPGYLELPAELEPPLLVAPSDDGEWVCFSDSREDLMEGYPSKSLPAGCGGDDLAALCAELQSIIRKAIPKLETTASEAGALRWMRKRRFSQVVYDRFCTLTASSLLQGLRDGSIVIKSDPAAIPMDYGEHTLSDAEPHDCRLYVQRAGEVLFDLHVFCWNFWRAGENPSDTGALCRSHGEGRWDDALRVAISEKSGMVVFYNGKEGLSEHEMTSPFHLPAGCQPDEIADLCAELQGWFERSLPGFDEICEADELAWLLRDGASHHIGFDDDGEIRADLWISGFDDDGKLRAGPCLDSLFVKAVSDRSHGRWIFGVEGVDRLFFCPKEAGEAAKAQLIAKLRGAAERAAATELVVPKKCA
jgi:hypothetical protein